MALLLLVNGFAPGALGGCASLLALSPEDDAADPEAPVKHLKAWGGQHVVDTSDIRRGEVWVLHSTWLDGTETYEVLVGPNEAPMSWPAFYRMVDRPDLAESFEQRSLIKEVADWTFIIGSAAAVIPIGLGIAGIAVFFTPLGGIPFGVILLGTAVLTAVGIVTRWPG